MNLKGFIKRDPKASKGDNGRVLIIGGSEQYVGAPVLAALAALRTGCDSVHIMAPKEAAYAMNTFSPDIITIKLPKDLRSQLKLIGQHAAKADVILVGPGLGQSIFLRELVNRSLTSIKKKLVIDADATRVVDLKVQRHAIVLANKREYDTIAGEPGTNIIVQKGATDIIHPAKTKINGGHVRATVIGTGDVLAGITAALYAQLDDPEKAAVAACTIAKELAAALGKTQGYGWTANDMVEMLPYVVKKIELYST